MSDIFNKINELEDKIEKLQNQFNYVIKLMDKLLDKMGGTNDAESKTF